VWSAAWGTSPLPPSAGVRISSQSRISHNATVRLQVAALQALSVVVVLAKTWASLVRESALVLAGVSVVIDVWLPSTWIVVTSGSVRESV